MRSPWAYAVALAAGAGAGGPGATPAPHLLCPGTGTGVPAPRAGTGTAIQCPFTGTVVPRVVSPELREVWPSDRPLAVWIAVLVLAAGIAAAVGTIAWCHRRWAARSGD